MNLSRSPSRGCANFSKLRRQGINDGGHLIASAAIVPPASVRRVVSMIHKADGGKADRLSTGPAEGRIGHRRMGRALCRARYALIEWAALRTKSMT
jgi:hypothetical protein